MDAYLYNRWYNYQTLSQSLCTALMAGNSPVVRFMQEDCFPMNNGGHSHRLIESTVRCNWGNLNLYSNQPITKGWCQPIGGHIPQSHSHSTGSPTATGRRLCNSPHSYRPNRKCYLIPRPANRTVANGVSFCALRSCMFNTLKSDQYGRLFPFADDNF